MFTILSSCATYNQISLLCNEQHIDLYIDEEHVGRGLINYTLPKKHNYINVSCRENGIEVYSKRYFVRGCKNCLFEINIPINYYYSDPNK